MVCAAPTESERKAVIDRVPDIFKAYTPRMTTEAALVLPEYSFFCHWNLLLLGPSFRDDSY